MRKLSLLILFTPLLLLTALMIYLSNQSLILSPYLADNVGYLANTTHSITGFTELLLTTFSIFKNSILAYNLVYLFNIVLTGYASYILIQKIFNDKKKTFKYLLLLFPLLIIISPIRIWYSYEWLSLSNWGFILFTIAFLLSFLKNKSYKGGILLGISLSLTFYNHPYQLAMSLIIVGITILITELLKYKTFTKKYLIKLIKNFSVLGITTTIMTGVFLIPWMLNPDQNGQTIINFSRSPADRWAYSAKPWHYLIPNIHHPILGNIAVKTNYWIWQHNPYYLTEPFFPKEHTLYLGYTLMFLSIYTVYLTYIKKRKGKRGIVNTNTKLYVTFFLIISISAFIFSMPPYMTLHGIKVYFPSNFLYFILPQFRAYARFGVFVFISNTALAMIGLNYIIQNIKTKRNKYIIFSAITLFILFEFLPSIYTISTKPTLSYQWLSEQQNNFTYLEYPRRINYTDRLYQSTHNKKILNPYLTTPQNVVKLEKSINNDSFCKLYKKENLKYILVHKKKINKYKVVQEFVKTGIVNNKLKIALAESWGQPIWGNHIKEQTKKKEYNKDDFIKDPKFKLIKNFPQKEIARERPNKNFSADKFDSVTIFGINEHYCNKLH